MNTNEKKDINKCSLSEEEFKELAKIISDNNSFNQKKTSIKIDKEDAYDSLINIINKLSDKEQQSFFDYLYRLDIEIFKVIINGYLNFQDKDIELIKKIIKNYFNKNLFYFIYKKLSKIYRNPEKIKNTNDLLKFEKLMTIWKLLYNIEVSSCPVNLKGPDPPIAIGPNNNIYITLDSIKKEINSQLKDKNQEIKLKQLFITINFKPFFINQFNKEFNLFELYENEECKYQYSFQSFINNEEFKAPNSPSDPKAPKVEQTENNKENYNKINYISEVNTIILTINDTNWTISVNGKDKALQNKLNLNNISKFIILNNFLGEIKSVRFKAETYIGKSTMIEFKLPIKEDKKWKKINLDLRDIGYFGGFESFIPLFKIIKNMILKFVKDDGKNNIIVNEGIIINDDENKNINKNNIEENNDDKIIKLLTFINDILKTMIKIVCISEDNYVNFLKIMVPLISSLAEIMHVLNNLFNDKSDKYLLIHKSNKYIPILLGDEIYFIIYIIILNSNLSNRIKKVFEDFFFIKEFSHISLKSIFFDVADSEKNEFYFLMLFNIFLFILLYYGDSKKDILDKLKDKLNEVCKKIKNKNLDVVISLSISLVNSFYSEEEINSEKLSKISQFFLLSSYYTNFIIYMIKTYLNTKSNHKNVKNEIFQKIESIINCLSVQFKKNIKTEIKDMNKKLLINHFKYYIKEKEFIQNLFPDFLENYFIANNELIMDELIDYHGQYHHLMKELFIFNRLWSNQKLFFKNSLKELKNSKLKYKNINYYTRNFQRPIIYPILDYKNRYPDFSKFNNFESLYMENQENKDDYNFDLDCPELDNFNDKLDKELLDNINEKGKENDDIYIFQKTCLVKQGYHIKGDLYIIKKKDDAIIYFISYPYENQKGSANRTRCNSSDTTDEVKTDKDKADLYKPCYGALFNCPKKENRRKIKIYFNDIRLILKKIYYYRCSAVEIFTQTKSYYFNFLNEENLNILYFVISLYNDLFLPIKINKDECGFKKKNKLLCNKKDFNMGFFGGNDFVKYIIKNSGRKEQCEICIFDLILLINLISNRSFIDIFQYPVFPLLFIYKENENDKDQDKNILTRDLSQFIGFQELTEKSKERKKRFEDSYKGGKEDKEEDIHYFMTFYSNATYTSHFLIRLMPYSFFSIELQGDSFDDPNRLFFSIESTFQNMVSQKSDLRELIPEFFYFPEMFMNINSFNFGIKTNNQIVDDVLVRMEKNNQLELKREKEKKDKEKEDKEKEYKEKENKDKKNEDKDKEKEDKEKENKEKEGKNKEDEDKQIDVNEYFLFIQNMKNYLESCQKNISDWLNIIFGPQQNYNKNNKNKELMFNKTGYLNIKDEFNNYSKNTVILDSIEFGLIPLQTLNSKLDIKDNDYCKDKSKTMNDNLKIFKNKNIEKKYEIPSYLKEKTYFWDDLDFDFKIDEDKIGKLNIYKNGFLIYEINDHTEKIEDYFYNKRLNMFATTSSDGFICVYILPNKLISMIKNPNNSLYNQIFLSANPFPSIIAWEHKKKFLTSYSLSGIKIKETFLDIKDNYKIIPYFNVYGGTFKDRILITGFKDNKVDIAVDIPFFDNITILNQ